MVGISSFPWAEEHMIAAEEAPTPKVDKVTRRVCISGEEDSEIHHPPNYK